jgi:tetratricopeptide (TPR) repeat protein
MIALTADAVWIQETWRLRSMALDGLEIERRRHGEELALTPSREPSGEELTLTFAGAAEGQRWFDKIRGLQSKPIPDAPTDERVVPEGVALVRRAPDVPHVPLGRVGFVHRTPGMADRGVQLRAGIRSLTQHNLEVAHRLVEGLRERAFEEEINKLGRAGRFADAIDLFKRSIKEQDERARSGKDRDAALPSLAYRLDRLAWFLAHCPDRHLRDTKAAVEYARRATGLRSDVVDYWYTLAMVQYRQGDWRESLAALDRVKAKQGELDASDWLLSAMDLHRLNRQEEARAAMQKAIDWMGARSRKAAGDPLLRMENEMMWPAIEALLREAKDLIDGEGTTRRKAAQADALAVPVRTPLGNQAGRLVPLPAASRLIQSIIPGEAYAESVECPPGREAPAQAIGDDLMPAAIRVQHPRRHLAAEVSHGRQAGPWSCSDSLALTNQVSFAAYPWLRNDAKIPPT